MVISPIRDNLEIVKLERDDFLRNDSRFLENE